MTKRTGKETLTTCEWAILRGDKLMRTTDGRLLLFPSEKATRPSVKAVRHSTQPGRAVRVLIEQRARWWRAAK